MIQAHINRIATGVPRDDVHTAFVHFADAMQKDPRVNPVFQRMAQRSGIEIRFSVLTPTHRLKAAWLKSRRMANDEKLPLVEIGHRRFSDVRTPPLFSYYAGR